MRIFGGIMMVLSICSGVVASIIVAMLMWDTLAIVGADVEPIRIADRLVRLARWIGDFF